MAGDHKPWNVQADLSYLAVSDLCMKRYNAAIIFTVTANALALAAALFLALGPAYQGESVAAVASGGVAGEPARTTATLIEVDGTRVLYRFLGLVLLTALAALAATVVRADSVLRGPLVLALGVLLLAFCIAALPSIGLFLLPAAFALIIAGVVMSVRRRRI